MKEIVTTRRSGRTTRMLEDVLNACLDIQSNNTIFVVIFPNNFESIRCNRIFFSMLCKKLIEINFLTNNSNLSQSFKRIINRIEFQYAGRTIKILFKTINDNDIIFSANNIELIGYKPIIFIDPSCIEFAFPTLLNLWSKYDE